MISEAKLDEFDLACREVGLPSEMVQKLRERLLQSSVLTHAAPATARELEIMKLIGAESPDKLVHDVRNILNEVALLRALSEIEKD